LYISLEFLEGIQVDGVEREDAKRLGDTLMVVVWFLAICSIVSMTFRIPLYCWLTVSGCPRSLHSPWQTRVLPSQDPLAGFHVPIKG